jgi:hypothetical protein
VIHGAPQRPVYPHALTQTLHHVLVASEMIGALHIVAAISSPKRDGLAVFGTQ